MGEPLVLDTSFLVAAVNERDRHHREALAVQEQVAAGAWRPVLTDSVLLETANVLLGRRGAAFSVRVVRHLVTAHDVLFVATGPRLEATLRAFEAHAKDGLSMTDCTLLVVLREFRAAGIATFDRDFAAVPGVRLVP